MPMIKFAGSSNPDFTTLFIRMQIIAYMLFPEDGDPRNRGYISQWGGKGRDAILSATREQVSGDLESTGGLRINFSQGESWEGCRNALADLVTEEMYDAFGGMGTAGTMPSENQLNNIAYDAAWDWVRVGVLYRLVLDFSMHFKKPVSMADVIAVYRCHNSFSALREHKTRDGERFNGDAFEDKVIYGLRKKYGKVAHFCAALSVLAAPDYTAYKYWAAHGIEMWSDEHKAATLCHFIMYSPDKIFKLTCKSGAIYTGTGMPIQAILALAREYQLLGLKYKLKKSNQTLLPQSAWKIPEMSNGWHGVPLVNIPPPSYRRLFQRYSR